MGCTLNLTASASGNVTNHRCVHVTSCNVVILAYGAGLNNAPDPFVDTFACVSGCEHLYLCGGGGSGVCVCVCVCVQCIVANPRAPPLLHIMYCWTSKLNTGIAVTGFLANFLPPHLHTTSITTCTYHNHIYTANTQESSKEYVPCVNL